ncbi:hypothetical protein [Psychroserpens ponticola]|uniref:OmpH family outer membrane protein n=1 Tax=Psychroserpens ponticola TaxID=2932268 RepID=A0ABY7S0G8_9FLAO|nr:hypothetical protein [Psychroserpens ponticola]WCO02793.1 hypothetical protein MUN68_004685 [Psychroserpens ponticola]
MPLQVKIKRNLLLLSLVLTTLVYSQQIPDSLNTPLKRATLQTKEMSQKLNLTDIQIPVIDSLNLVYANEVEKEIISSNKSKISKYFKMKDLLNKKEAVLKQILTQVQFKIYEEMRSKAMNNVYKNAF